MQGARRRAWWAPRPSRATPQTPFFKPTLRDRANFASFVVVASSLGANPTSSAPPRLKRNLPRSRPRGIPRQAPGFDHLCPLRYPCGREERWPSGRRRTPGKCVTPNRVRGFDKIAGSDFGRTQCARRARAGTARVHPTLSATHQFMVARVCIFATTGHEPRQARKGAAVEALSRAPKSCWRGPPP